LYCSTNKGIVLRIASDRSVRHLKIHNDTINGLAINKNAPNILYTSSLDETAVVYDIEKQTIKVEAFL
jgi:WD40 repeat protein